MGGAIANPARDATFITAVKLVLEGASVWTVLTSGVLVITEIVAIAGGIFMLA